MHTKKTMNVSNDFDRAVFEYKTARKLRSWTQALAELATIGLVSCGFDAPNIDVGEWGGDRKSDAFRKADSDDNK